MNPDRGRGGPADERRVEDEPPPPGGSWTRLYAIVIGWLIVQILVYWIFTAAYS